MLSQLTTLRYFAAVGVMLSHLAFLGTSTDPGLSMIYEELLRQGSVGVSFFFVLSGFIISCAYRNDLAARRMPVSEFLIRRAMRIFPLHWMVALSLIAWLTVVRDQPVNPLTGMLNLLLLHSWAVPGDVHYSLNGPSWSLSNELFFYAVFPLLMLLPTRALAVGTATAVAVVAALASGSPAAYSNALEWLFYVNPAVRLIEFAAGMLLFELYRRGRGRWLGGTANEALLFVLVPVAMIAANVLAVTLAWRYQLFFLPLMIALVFVFAWGDGAVSRLLRTPALVGLGEASFALYLLHRPIFILADQIGGAGRSVYADLLLAAALLIGCTVLSVQVHRLIDRPLQSWLRQHLPQRRRSNELAHGIASWKP